LQFDDLFFLKSEPQFREACDLTLKLTIPKCSFDASEDHVIAEQPVDIRINVQTRLTEFPSAQPDDHVIFEKVNKASGRYLFNGDLVLIVRKTRDYSSESLMDQYLSYPAPQDEESGSSWMFDRDEPEGEESMMIGGAAFGGLFMDEEQQYVWSPNRNHVFTFRIELTGERKQVSQVQEEEEEDDDDIGFGLFG
jgi:hypothetical protein